MSDINTTPIAYEQPLNEQVRACLRLEHLFQQIHTHKDQTDTDSSHITIIAMLKALDVIDRPDLKAKLTHLLNQQATTLGQLEQFPQVDCEKLKTVLAHLDQLITQLQQAPTKLITSLGYHPLLKQIHKQLYNPAGVCRFAVPAYDLWLHQSSDYRQHDLNHWYQELALLDETVTMILQLIRASSPQQAATATNEFFQQSLDPNLPCQLIRVILPASERIYPEISVGKHRLSIRFKALTKEHSDIEPPHLSTIPFYLHCCRL